MHRQLDGSAAVPDGAPESAEILTGAQVRLNDQDELTQARADALATARLFTIAIDGVRQPRELHQLAKVMAKSANRLAHAAAWAVETSGPA